MSWMLLPAAPGRTQDAYELNGTVTDSTGGVIVGARLELIGGSRPRSAQTDEAGRYRFTGVPAGNYELSVSHDGFVPVTNDAVHVFRDTTVDVELQVFVTAEVHVAPVTGPGDGGSALLTQVLSGSDLDDLPNDPGHLLNRLRELAGATGRPQDLTIYVDGFRQVMRLQPTASIEMIRISSNPFAAEFAEPGRARVEIISKPGSERYHGELKFGFNDSTLNSRHVFAPTRAPVTRRNYSGYFSGPIVPRHWSVVLYGGRWEQHASEVVNATVLNPATLTPAPFMQEVVTPRTIDNVWIKTHHRIGARHTAALSFGHTRDEALNQGLDRALDLPERAYTRSQRERVARMAVTSTLGPLLLNETRLQASRSDSSTRALTDAPAVTVLDAFNGGGNQNALFRLGRSDELHASNHVTFARGRSTVKLGAAADVLRQRDTDRTGFGGTFLFGADVERDGDGAPAAGAEQDALIDPIERYRRTLLNVPGYGPSQFWIVRGDPEVAFWQWWAGWFAQLDWTPLSRVSLSAGVRHDVQAHVPVFDGLNPRVGLGWTLDEGGRHTVRAGAGLFYDRIPSSVTFDSHRLDGTRQRRLIIDEPGRFPDIPEEALPDAQVRMPAVHLLDPDLRAPRSALATVSYDARILRNLFASAAYSRERGMHLLRQRNVNAPIAGVPPLPDRGAMLQYETSARSERQELVIGLRTGWARPVTVFGNYTLASTWSDTDGPTTLPADSYSLDEEFGAGGTDVRHAATLGIRLRTRSQWIASTFVVLRSGRPFNITTGRDNNGDTLFTDRPAFADPSDPGAVVTPFGVFDSRPQAGDPIIPRNYGREPAQARVDLHVSRAVRIGPGRTSVRLGTDVVNVFNRANLARVNGVLTSATFGQARGAHAPRRVDLFVRMSF